MNYERLTIVVTKAEMDALRDISQRELRRPRDQARLLLRSALGLTDQKTHNDAGFTVTGETGAVAAIAR